MRSKTLIVLMTLLMSVALFAQTAGPIWIGATYPSITFASLGTKPTLSTPPPTVIDTTMLYFSFSGRAGGTVTLAEVHGDSLIIEAATDIIIIDPPIIPDKSDLIMPPIYSGTGFKFVFDNAGVYKAYLRENVVCIKAPCPPVLTYLGNFRILPKITSTPTPLLAQDSAKIRLLIGQEMRLCDHTYRTGFKLADSIIYLSSIADTDYICWRMMVTSPVAFGPTFNLGLLPAGTYQLIIEDSIKAGTITVYNQIIVNGTVRQMIHPMLNMIPPAIPNTRIFAVTAPQCDWYYGTDKVSMDTLWTVSDSAGHFSLTIPNMELDFEVTALAKGYLPQTMFTGNYPLSKSLPPQLALSYELIADGQKDSVNVVAKVTNNGAPVESVYISLNGGKEPLVCPLYALAKSSSAGSYTGKDGTVLLKGLSLSPYIDYVWSAYKYSAANPINKTGLIRLNAFIDPDTLFIEFNPTSAEANAALPAVGQILVSPNPCNKPLLTLSFANPAKSARLAIFDVSGRKVADMRGIKDGSVRWNTGNLGSGVYIVRADIGGRRMTRTVMVQR